MKNSNLKRITKIALLTATALMVFIIEGLFPPIFMFAPGTKLGLSGMVITFTIISLGVKDAFIVLFLKCFLSSVFGGNIFMIYYSLPSGILALTVGAVLLNLKRANFGIVSISIASAVTHNAVQIVMASILYKNSAFLYYISYASLVGVVAGFITGVCLYYIIKYMPPKIACVD